MKKVCQIYSEYILKEWKITSKQKVRAEHQEYTNQDVAYAFVQKLFPNGHLIDIDSNTANEERT